MVFSRISVNFFSRLVLLLGIAAFLVMLTVLLLTLLNPIWEVKQDSRYYQPVINVYVDTSASMNVLGDVSKIRNFLDELIDLWPGKVATHFFSDHLDPRVVEKDRLLDYLKNKGFMDSPTLFTPLQENFFFADKEQYYLLISDFLFRDGFYDLSNWSGINSSNLFYVRPEKEITSKAPNRAAVFILNTDNRMILDEGSKFLLQLMFYSDTPKKKLSYRIYYQTPQMLAKNPNNKTWIKSGAVATEDHYQETTMELTIPSDTWLHLGVEITGAKQLYSDRINLLPPRKKISIQMLYFKINRDAFAVKNSLDRYKDYQVKTLYVGNIEQKKNPLKKPLIKDWKLLEKRLSILSTEQDLFFLVEPPQMIVDWFRKKKIPFIHIPFLESQKNSIANIVPLELDFSFSPIDFLGEKDVSLSRWQQASPHLRGKPIPITSKNILLHRTGSRSAFFIRNHEMYWGIRNLFFLNDNILEVVEKSYWDIFLLKTLDFAYEHIKVEETTEISHNYFLAEKIINPSLINTMPYLVKIAEDYYVSPYLNKSGAYPVSQKLPPINYRIPFEEYFPPPPPSDIPIISLEKALESIRNIERQPIPQVIRKVAFRELPLYAYLVAIMIFLFMMLLAFKWYDNRRQLG